MFEVAIKHGNAVQPYRTVSTQLLKTEFAANLYGSLECAEKCKDDMYHYWSITHSGPQSDTPAILA
jgi:hypothetical protein